MPTRRHPPSPRTTPTWACRACHLALTRSCSHPSQSQFQTVAPALPSAAMLSCQFFPASRWRQLRFAEPSTRLTLYDLLRPLLSAFLGHLHLFKSLTILGYTLVRPRDLMTFSDGSTICFNTGRFIVRVIHLAAGFLFHFICLVLVLRKEYPEMALHGCMESGRRTRIHSLMNTYSITSSPIKPSNQPTYIFLPPVTRMVSPLTYEKSGLATPKIALAASSGLAGRRSGISGY